MVKKKRQIKHGEGFGGRTRLWVTRYNLDSVTGIGNQGFGDIRSYRPMLAFLPFFAFSPFFFFFLEPFFFFIEYKEYKRKRIYRENRLLLVQSCEETCSREEQKQWKRVFL